MTKDFVISTGFMVTVTVPLPELTAVPLCTDLIGAAPASTASTSVMQETIANQATRPRDEGTEPSLGPDAVETAIV